MKRYSSANHVSLSGFIILATSSFVMSMVIGVLAYLVSQYIYFIFFYSAAIGVIALIAYNRLLQSQKVRHAILTAGIGLFAGTIIWLAYYGTPYLNITQ